MDFANISSEFEKTNQAYFDELQSELGDELDSYSNLFKAEAEITAGIEQIKDINKTILKEYLDESSGKLPA